MTDNLPIEMQWKEAELFAREEVRTFREGFEIFGIQCRLLDSDDSQRLAREIVKRFCRSHVDNMMTIADYARQGWTLADEALRELAREMSDCGEHSKVLDVYVMEQLKGAIRRLPAQRRENHFLRDVAVTCMIVQLIERFEIRPTRNPTTKRKPSACSIVADAIGKNEAAVVAIWTRMKKYL